MAQHANTILTPAKVSESQSTDPMAERVVDHVTAEVQRFAGPIWTAKAAVLMCLLQQMHEYATHVGAQADLSCGAELENLCAYFNALMPIHLAGFPDEQAFLTRQASKGCTCSGFAQMFGRSDMIGSCMHSAKTDVVFRAGQPYSVAETARATLSNGTVVSGSSIADAPSATTGEVDITGTAWTPFPFGYLKQAPRSRRKRIATESAVVASKESNSVPPETDDAPVSLITPVTPLGRWQESIFSVANADPEISSPDLAKAWDLDSVFDFDAASAAYEC